MRGVNKFDEKHLGAETNLLDPADISTTVQVPHNRHSGDTPGHRQSHTGLTGGLCKGKWQGSPRRQPRHHHVLATTSVGALQVIGNPALLVRQIHTACPGGRWAGSQQTAATSTALPTQRKYAGQHNSAPTRRQSVGNRRAIALKQNGGCSLSKEYRPAHPPPAQRHSMGGRDVTKG